MQNNPLDSKVQLPLITEVPARITDTQPYYYFVSTYKYISLTTA